MRPQVLKTKAVQRGHKQTDTGDGEGIVDVRGVAYGEENEQVVENHHHEHAEVQPLPHQITLSILVEGIPLPKNQWHLHSAFCLHP